MSKPMIIDDQAYQLLRNENIAEFNRRKDSLDLSRLRGCDYRGLDLRNLEAAGLDLRDAYFRSTDLRGIDFREANLEGATLTEAKISGCYFPDTLSPEEIRLSLEHGTRLRCRK